MAESFVGTDSPREDLHRGCACGFAWSVVVEVGGVGNGQWPQCFVVNFRPMKSCVDHHCPCLSDHYLDGTFRNAVLPFGTNTTKSELLFLVNDFLGEGLALVDSVAGVVGIDLHSMITSHPLEGSLDIDGVSGIQCDLMFHVDQT